MNVERQFVVHLPSRSNHVTDDDNNNKLPLDRLLLETMAALCFSGEDTTSSSSNRLHIVPTQPEKKENRVSTVALTCTTINPWMDTTVTTTAVGWVGVLQALCPSWLLPVHKSWLDALTDSSLWMMMMMQWLPTSNNNNVEALQTNAVEFIHQMDAHLQRHAYTFLDGTTYATLSDIVVALSLAHYASASTTTLAIPQQAHRFMTTVIGKLITTLEQQQQQKNQYHRQSYQRLLDTLRPFVDLPACESRPVAPITTVARIATPTTTANEATPSATKVESQQPADTDTVLPTRAPTDGTTTTKGSDVRILELLTQWNIPFEMYEHTLCHTAEELVQKVPLPDPTTQSHTKNLFLRDKKHGCVLITAKPTANIVTSDIKTYLNLSGGKCNFRLASEELLAERLHCRPGCVGPLCLGLAGANATDKMEPLTLILDKSLLALEQIHSHPARNDQSVRLTPTALLDYLKQAGFAAPVLVDFGEAAAVAAAAASAAVPSGGKAPATRPPAAKKEKSATPSASAQHQAQPLQKKVVKKGETLLALQWKKSENFAMWYSDVIVLSEMISYYDISGCYILRPWSYKMWELIQEWFNVEIQKMGVENAYFPLFVSQDRLEKEKDHVEGFAPEVAWVTKSGDGELARPIAIRPTSETIMYPAYSDWIQSHRDLPLKLNQWSNVVRWEFKYPTPFLRTREFLWQEGHTAHSTFEDADETVMQALELYRAVYEELLAVPVVKGYKTEKEKFAGGFRTTTVEAYIAGSGRAIQGATSHNLGQNFGKMFDITFQNEKGQSEVAWQTSWGLTTRTIGVMVMVHGDDQGLVLPPRVAPLQVVIVPIVSKKLLPEDAAPYCLSILQDLQANGVRAKYDDRTAYNPGWKYNHWEQKGVPIRVEVGPMDIEKKSARIVVRHDGTKLDLPADGLGKALSEQLKEIQTAMFNKAKAARDSHVVQITEWKDFVPNLEKNNLVLTPWCGGEHEEWEEWVKTTSREESLKARGEEGEDEQTATSVAAKTLCIPFDQPELPAGTKCIASGMDAKCWVLWGRSY